MSTDLLQSKNRKRGRPRVGETTPVQVRMNAKALAALDAWRRQQDDLPGRPEAIRRLVDRALATTAKPPPPPAVKPARAGSADDGLPKSKAAQIAALRAEKAKR